MSDTLPSDSMRLSIGGNLSMAPSSVAATRLFIFRTRKRPASRKVTNIVNESK